MTGAEAIDKTREKAEKVLNEYLGDLYREAKMIRDYVKPYAEGTEEMEDPKEVLKQTLDYLDFILDNMM